MTLKQLLDQKAAKVRRLREIGDAAATEERDYTEVEATEVAAIKAELGTEDKPGPLQVRINEAQYLQEQERSMAALGTVHDPAQQRSGEGRQPTHVHDNILDKPWDNDGEFFAAVAESFHTGGSIDPRLLEHHGGRQAAATGMGSVSGGDGGFLVGTERSQRLLEAAQEMSMLYGYCARQPIGSNADGIEMPYVDETDRSGGTVMGGVRVYRRAEAATVAASQAKLGMLEIRLEDVMGLTYVTGRLLQDATALEAFVRRGFANAYGFKLDDEIMNGSGAGQCMGFLSTANAALISVAAETGQGRSDPLLFENVSNMHARMLPRNRRNSIWTINPELEPYLERMVLTVGTGGVPVYMPAQGVSSEGYGTLYGRPVVPIEHAAAKNSKGDISFVDLSEYMLIEKGQGEVASSMHVRFAYDEMTFRFTHRINGRPVKRSTLQLAKGSATYSPYITLAART